VVWWAVQSVMVAALLAAVVWGLCRFRRIGPTARHALWLVVLVKLLTPPLVAWPWGVPNPLRDFVGLEGMARVVNEPTAPALEIQRPSSAVTHDGSSVKADKPDSNDYSTPPTVDPGSTPTSSSAIGFEEPTGTSAFRHLAMLQRHGLGRDLPGLARAALIITWILGGIAYAVVQVVRIRRMVLMARGGREADASLVDRVGRLAARIGMRPVVVRVVDRLDSPVVFSAGRPVLLWPGGLARTVGESSMDGLIVHELAHVRRRDHWVGWLELAAGLAWWWNPLFWYVRHQVRENAELACDGWVVGVNPSGRRAYAEALLSVCECMSSRRSANPAPALGVGTGGREFLERRLKMILRDRVPLRVSRFGVVMIGLLATSALPAWSQKSGTAEKTVGDAYQKIKLYSADVGLGELVIASGVSSEPLPQEAEQLIAQFEQGKAEAQREMEQRMSRAREELTRQLRDLQDGYTKAGKLDEAVAIRDRLRSLEGPGMGGGAPTMGLPGGSAVGIGSAEQSGNLTAFRNRVGQTLTLHVVGSTEGNVWGKDVYTDDSTVAAAAVHAGVLRSGEAGEVRVTILPGRPHYDGASQNGVESRSYEAWPGSYRFHPRTAPRDGLSGGSSGTVRVGEGPRTLEELRDRVGQTFTFVVTGATDGPVWGGAENVYTTDSDLGTAAVHAGVLRPGERGVITVKILPDRGSYEGENRNGVESQPWGAWHGSYRVGPDGDRPHLNQPAEPRTY